MDRNYKEKGKKGLPSLAVMGAPAAGQTYFRPFS